MTLSNDPSNEARGLKLLQQAGLITLKPGAGFDATPNDIADNPKSLKSGCPWPTRAAARPWPG